MTATDLILSAMGEAGVLCETARPLNELDQRRFWELARLAGEWPEVREAVTGMNNLLVLFDPRRIAPEAVEHRLAEAWADARPSPRAARTLEVPVIYGGEHGLDLRDVAEGAGLSVEDCVRLHSGAEYLVHAIGAVPGFPYLSGLPARLARPRRDVPRTLVPEGAVMLGGVQAGIMPVASPSGWHVLGRTPLRLFDPAASPPVLLGPGDRVRFTVQEVIP